MQGYKSPPKNPRPNAGGFVKVQAYAKINLFLDVLGKRDDGYHNILSVMQSVSLCDEITIKCRNDASSNTAPCRLTCDMPGIPTDENNLVLKAANALIREHDIPHGFDISLKKRIPAGAGLAGGSSDCAATLLGIKELLNLNISFERLLETAKNLGADVPFCLVGGTALAEGIGEQLTVLPPHPPCFIVIACPPVHVSTAEIFAKIDAVGHGDATKIKAAIASKNAAQTASELYNCFTPITSALYPEISGLINKFKNMGALGASMTGTGSSVFAYFNNENIAHAALNKIEKYAKTYLCTPVGTAGFGAKLH